MKNDTVKNDTMKNDTMKKMKAVRTLAAALTLAGALAGGANAQLSDGLEWLADTGGAEADIPPAGLNKPTGDYSITSTGNATYYSDAIHHNLTWDWSPDGTSIVFTFAQPITSFAVDLFNVSQHNNVAFSHAASSISSLPGYHPEPTTVTMASDGLSITGHLGEPGVTTGDKVHVQWDSLPAGTTRITLTRQDAEGEFPTSFGLTSLDYTLVPEPSSMLLSGLGGLLALLLRRRR